MRKLQVGIIGYGLSGSVFHAPIIRAVDRLRLRAFVSSKPDVVRRDWPDAEVTGSVEELLAMDDLDIVVVTSPNPTHADYARLAIEAGKHVVVEKPFTVTSQEADELIRLSAERGVLLSAYHNRRWDNDFLTVRKVLASDQLGRLSVYEAHFDRYRPEVRRRWREQALPGSGLLYDLGSHLIDQALQLFGLPQRVWADVRTERDGAEADDCFHVVLYYANHRAILRAGSLVRSPGPRYAIHGTAGSFVKFGIDPQEDQLKAGLKPGDPGWGVDRPDAYGKLAVDIGGLSAEAVVETEIGCYEAYYEGIADAVLLGKPLPVRAEEARDVIRVIECARLSHEQQRVVPYEG